MFMKGGILLLAPCLAQMLLGGPCMGLVQHLLDSELPPAVLMIFVDFADLL